MTKDELMGNIHLICDELLEEFDKKEKFCMSLIMRTAFHDDGLPEDLRKELITRAMSLYKLEYFIAIFAGIHKIVTEDGHARIKAMASYIGAVIHTMELRDKVRDRLMASVETVVELKKETKHDNA